MLFFLSYSKKRERKKERTTSVVKKKCHWGKCHEKSISNWTCLSNRRKKDYFSDNSCHSQRKLISSTQTFTSFLLLIIITQQVNYMQEKKPRSKVNNKIKREKNPFFSLPSTCPFFLCVYVCMFYQYINLQLVLHNLKWLRNRI